MAAPSAASSSRQQRALAAAAGAQQPGGIDLSALGLEIPDIDASDIATYQQELGAEFDVSGCQHGMWNQWCGSKSLGMQGCSRGERCQRGVG